MLNARQLAGELAKRTQFLRDQVVIKELKEEFKKEEFKKTSPVKSSHILVYFKFVKQYLIPDLTEEIFADLYSQTVTYGLFAARTRCPGDFHRKKVIQYIPNITGILRNMFETISMGHMPEQLLWAIDDIVDVLASANVNNILKEFCSGGNREDPIIHFYEIFLSQYDPGLREKCGVYYTPESVVSFIARSVHRILKEKFNKPDGLADLHVNIMDPAAGTLTFITEAAKIALEECIGKSGQGAKRLGGRPTLKNFYAFERMMAPYAIGHLRMSYFLDEIGYHMVKGEQFNLYLANSLEMENIENSENRENSEESRPARKIEAQTPILVILGNPPYSGHSANTGEWISREIKEYYEVDGKPLNEKNPKWLQDDYVKFIRFAQSKIDRNGEGVLGFITNHSYLDNPTFRGMRQSLMKSFDEIYLLDLHGNSLKKERCPDGSKDENVFDIRPGVAIALMIKTKCKNKPGNVCTVYHADMWGLRENKYQQLKEGDINAIPWRMLSPSSGFYFFIPHNNHLDNLYQKWIKIPDIFPVYSVGIVTARDKLTIHDTPENVFHTVSQFAKITPEQARAVYNLGPDRHARDWTVSLAQEDLIKSGISKENIVPILYRPFDIRYTYYTGNSSGFLCRPRPDVMRHMLNENLGLIFHRREELQIKYSHFFITENIVEHGCLSTKTTCFVSPLYRYFEKNITKNKGSLISHHKDWENRQPNINYKIFQDLQSGFMKKNKQKITVTAEDIFYYIYAVLYSDIYRERYAELLKIDFPRVPLTNDYLLFNELGRLGKALVEIHLLESAELDSTFSRFEMHGTNGTNGTNRVEKIKFSANNVYINKEQYFSNISQEIWNYRIGGYQVMDKWLKDRRGRALSLEDIQHYIRVARALELTGQYRQKIDQLFPKVE